jgi:uncharacterized membrane protein
MQNGNAGDPDRPYFSVVLTPHRSLGRRGLAVLLGGVGVVSVATSLAFSLVGAWPVVGFVGLDVALIGVAFAANYRAARAFEEVKVFPHEVVVRQVPVSGGAREFRCNPAWARLEIERIEDEGVTRIRLTSRGRSVRVGDFLNPEDRGTFAEAFRAALVDARSGGARREMA